MAAGLAHITEAHQVGQQAVRATARDVELVGNGSQLQAFAMLRQQFQNAQGSFEDAAHVCVVKVVLA